MRERGRERTEWNANKIKKIRRNQTAEKRSNYYVQMLCKTFTHTQANKYLSRYYSSALYLSRHIKSPPVSVLPFYRANLISMLTMLMKMSWNIQRTISCVLFATNIKWNEKQAKRERARKNKRARENESEMAEKEWASVCVCGQEAEKRERNWEAKPIWWNGNWINTLLPLCSCEKQGENVQVRKSIECFYLCSISHRIAI